MLTLGCNCNTLQHANIYTPSLISTKQFFLRFLVEYFGFRAEFFFFTSFETANSSDLAKCGYIEGERPPFPPVIKQILVWNPQKNPTTFTSDNMKTALI